MSKLQSCIQSSDLGRRNYILHILEPPNSSFFGVFLANGQLK